MSGIGNRAENVVEPGDSIFDRTTFVNQEAQPPAALGAKQKSALASYLDREIDADRVPFSHFFS
jgi:hypothetical protein